MKAIKSGAVYTDDLSFLPGDPAQANGTAVKITAVQKHGDGQIVYFSPAVELDDARNVTLEK